LPRASGEVVRVVSLGKAAAELAIEAHRLLDGRVEGLAVHPERPAELPSSFRSLAGGHPLPDAGSLDAGAAVVRFFEDPAPGPLLVLLSGGASAIVEVPAEGLALADLRRTTTLLLASGAPIQATNTVRRHISALKGGGLALRRTGRPLVTLALSDVVGGAPCDIASGPTVGDPTSFAEAVAVARRWGFWDRLPTAVRERLARGARGRIPENPRPGDPRLRGHRFALMGSNATARDGAAREAARRGYRVTVRRGPVVGESSAVGVRLARQLLLARARAGRSSPPRAFVSGGETTVTLGRYRAPGGRNQELVLAAAPVLDGAPGVLLMSAGTDGIDGPTDAAGGWVDGRTASRARRLGVDLATALARHASYDTLRRLGVLWRPGPTGTNVADLQVGLVGAAGPTRRGTAGSSPRGAARSSRRSSS
jgi:glycerate 2-kinase